MTNNWTDIGNSTCIIVMGANPSENHPACMAHINRARDVQGAKLIVIDPRKTRTAAQADRYIRIRPGTDIAFNNGVLRWIIDAMENGTYGTEAVRTKFFNYLNQEANNSFYSNRVVDGSGNAKYAGVPHGSVATDARFVVNDAGDDYERINVVSDGSEYTGGDEEADASGIWFDVPKKVADVHDDENSVYMRLKANVEPYTLSVVADICGCTDADIEYVAKAFVDNSRCSSVGTVSTTGPTTDGQDPRVAGYKCTTMLYAMGLTQHTCGAQNVKSFTVLQVLMGNMGRAGGGINALRGIHNVQGSTDMGLLYGNIPGYSGNPTDMVSGGNGTTVPNDANAFGKYMDGLWGRPLSGSGGRAAMDGTYDDAYNLGNGTVTGDTGNEVHYWQQRGFYNMTTSWFGDNTVAGRAGIDALYNLWPKGQGDDHITMFRKMISGVTKAAVVWGQNPAVTEPNQSKVRDGLEALDLLVCVDMFENETAACKRRSGGITYLLPACSHVEEAGSVTNSGRCLQWRERATTPRGNSKADIELLLRLAKALSDNDDGFSHIAAVTGAAPVNILSGYDDVYDMLYGSRYGWDAASEFESVSGTAETWNADPARGADYNTPLSETVTGSEWVTERIYRELCSNLYGGGNGTMWLYIHAYSSSVGSYTHGLPAWRVFNRAKSRNTADSGGANGTLAYPQWGFAWLINRRVLYNNGEIPLDQADYFMGPDSAGRLFVSTNSNVLNYSRWYRKVHKLADRPDVVVSGPTTSNHHIDAPVGGKYSLAGRFPAFVEPYETPRATEAAYMAKWGRNTKNTAKWDCVPSNTEVYAPDDVAGSRTNVAAGDGDPLVLTTIRCVEHFQGGPITRNNAWNHEMEPVPWVEINSLDAAARGIKTGDPVNVITVRSDSMGDQEGRTTTTGWAEGFVARVGVGLQSNQRVGPGVVAIPWHWGDRGLSTGSRANDLCIDAGDANTTIPEYKACICWIEKA